MAISQPTQSLQYNPRAKFPADQTTNPGTRLHELAASLVFTAAGFTTAATGDLSLLTLPPGRLRIRLDLSRVKCPAGTTNADLDIGFAAYTKPDGTTQTAQANGLADSLDVGGGALDQNLSAGTVSLVDSASGVDVVASFDTANSPASGTLLVQIVYQREQL